MPGPPNGEASEVRLPRPARTQARLRPRRRQMGQGKRAANRTGAPPGLSQRLPLPWQAMAPLVASFGDETLPRWLVASSRAPSVTLRARPRERRRRERRSAVRASPAPPRSMTPATMAMRPILPPVPELPRRLPSMQRRKARSQLASYVRGHRRSRSPAPRRRRGGPRSPVCDHAVCWRRPNPRSASASVGGSR